MYTSLYGGYETLNEREFPSHDGIDFICFTDRADLTSKTWEIRQVDLPDIDAARKSRFVKLVPHRYLPDYEFSIYLDNIVSLKVDAQKLFALLEQSEHNFLCFSHPWRNCSYEEAEIVISETMDDERRVREQMDFYTDRQFPKNYGLIAGTLLIRRHGDAAIRSFGEDWLTHVLRFSKRDQLSFGFNAWKHKLSYGLLTGTLTENEWMQWPLETDRVPCGFNRNDYLWLNSDVYAAGVEPESHYREYGRRENRPYRYQRPIPLDQLANKYKSDKGTIYYNKHFYSRIYDAFLSPIREEPFSLIEIGLLRHDIQARKPNGPFDDAPSLKMWEDYFSNAEICGFDIQDFTAVESGRVKFVQGDQFSRNDLDAARERCTLPLKVIVDDGSHASHHQQASLAALFRHLIPGGLYFIEDLQYQPPSLEKAGAIKTIDILRSLKSHQQIASEFISNDDARYLADNIEFIEFFDSMDYNSVNIGADSLAVLKKK